MPELRMELQHLALADEHIADAEKRVLHMKGLLTNQRRAGIDTEISEAALEAVKQGLLQFRAERDHIISTLADMTAGRLPST